MTAVLFSAVHIMLLVAAIGLGCALAYCAAWRLVYVTLRCRRNPIGKSALLGSLFLWVISAGLLQLF